MQVNTQVLIASLLAVNENGYNFDINFYWVSTVRADQDSNLHLRFRFEATAPSYAVSELE